MLFSSSQGCSPIVEKGKPSNISCNYLGSKNSITWQMIVGNNSIDLSTCNVTSGECYDQLPFAYSGRFLRSLPGNYTVILDIKSARTNETRFRCVPEDEGPSDECLLQVYSLSSIVEKGEPSNFACNYLGRTNSITWQMLVGNKSIDLSTCNMTSGECYDQLPLAYSGQVLSSLPGNYTMRLDIRSARINETRFRCMPDDGVPSDQFFMQVYKWPSIPTSRIEFTSTTVELTFSSYVYPRLRAGISRRELALISEDIESWQCDLTDVTSDPNSDYLAECTCRIPVSRLLPSNTFYVQMWIPDTDSLQINRSPVVSADRIVRSGCVSVVAKDEHTAFSCTFQNSPNSITWQMIVGNNAINLSTCNMTSQVCVDEQPSVYNGRVISSLSGNYTMKLDIKSVRINETVFKCVTDSGDSSNECKLLTGSNSITVEVSNFNFNLCPDTKNNLTVTCKFPRNQVSSQPKFSIIIGSQTYTQTQTDVGTTQELSYSISFRPSSGGNLPITCRVENTIFPDSRLEKTVQVVVREPPSHEPLITVSLNGVETPSSDVINSSNGDFVTVSCLVDGGYPSVQSVFLSCGSYQRVTVGRRSTLILTASNQLNGQICYCRANHTSNCYNKDAGITLRVAIPSSSREDTQTNYVPIIVGVSVGLGALIVVVVVVVLVMKRRRPPSYSSERVTTPENVSTSQLSAEYPVTYSLPKISDAHIYDTVPPPSYYSNSQVNYGGFEPTPHRTNASPYNDYIDPIE